jgi:hypothetical protein
MKEAVERGVAEISDAYGTDHVRVVPDDQGGAWVEVADLDLGAPYLQDTTFLVCLLPFNLPAADVYPMFVRPDLTRADGPALGDGFQVTQLSWPGEPQPRAVVQVSRRTRGDFTAQTPAHKIEKVLDWIRSR